MQTRSRRFAPELIHEILGHLHEDKPALERCSLVCKAWVHPSRSHLFAEVILDDESLERFIAFRQRSAVVIPYIRRFHLMLFQNMEFWNDCIPHLVGSGFRRVRSLALQFQRHHFSVEAQSKLITQFTGVVSFFFIGPAQIEESRLADTICSFPRLEVLVLRNIRWLPTPTSGEDLVMSSRTISCHLHTLEICDVDAITLLSWILSFPNIPALRMLDLYWFSSTFRSLNNVLPNLQSLEKIALSFCGAEHDHNEFVDLSHQERLRSLHILHLTSPDPTKCAVRTLASITSTCVEKIVFKVPLIERGQVVHVEIEWRDVDAVLQSPQFSKLSTIQLDVVWSTSISPSPSINPQLVAWFLGRLPQCHARGILSVRPIVDYRPATISLTNMRVLRL